MELQAEIYDGAQLDPDKEHFHRAFLDRVHPLAEDQSFEVQTAWRMVDPEGSVGMEIFIAELSAPAGAEHGAFVQIPLTYRPATLGPEFDHALLGTMQHSELGERWVYDARHDPVFQRELTRTIEERLPAAQNKIMRNGEVEAPEVTLDSGPGKKEQAHLTIALEVLEPHGERTAKSSELRASWSQEGQSVTAVVAVQG